MTSRTPVYPAQDSEKLGEHYIRHVCAMTSESLHAKSDIARQLAARDKMLAVLWAEYEDRKAQWSGDYLWTKHEDAEAIEEVKAFITQTQNAELRDRHLKQTPPEKENDQ